MTREEAIHRIKDHMVHHGIGRFPHMLLAEAMKMAISALREQEEQSKAELSEPCEWCWHFAQDPQHLFAEGNGRYRELIYQFCPNCGRKLENRLEDGERFCSRCGQKRPVACTVDGKPWCEDCFEDALECFGGTNEGNCMR